jgi:SAM-dependent methyltransferase
VLEVAAGTGVVTRALGAVLAPEVTLVATDLNLPMLEHAQARGVHHAVTWRQADAMALPFGDGRFDVVVCQFGAMFFPDRPRAYAEARRVLRPGGTLLFNVWDRIEENDFAFTVTEALETVFPHDPPRFLARTPHGYSAPGDIAADLRRGGFAGVPRIETNAGRSRADTARAPAVAFCQGTPLRNEIEARDPAGLAHATDAAAVAIAARWGEGPVEGRMQAYVISATN